MNLNFANCLEFILNCYSNDDKDSISIIHTLTDTNKLLRIIDIDKNSVYKNNVKNIVKVIVSQNKYINRLNAKSSKANEVSNDKTNQIETSKDELSKANEDEQLEDNQININQIESSKVNQNELSKDEPLEDNQTNELSKDESLNNIQKILLETEGSYKRGILGEFELIKILQESHPDYIITRVASTGHVGDIHVDDELHNIKYVIECKLKQVITKADITKFINDVDNISKSVDNKYVYGIFVSLNSDFISSIGNVKCDIKHVYLTKTLISKDIFKLIFDMIPNYLQSIKNINDLKAEIKTELENEHNNELREYIIPDRIRQLTASLQIYNNNITEEEASIKKIEDNANSTLSEATKLKTKLYIRKQFIFDLNVEFNNEIIEVINVENNENPLDNDNEFIEFMKKTPKYKITKKMLLEKFSRHVTELSNMKIDEIVDKYHQH